MSENIKVSGRVYNGIESISVKNENGSLVDFILPGTTPPIHFYDESDVNFYDYDGTLVASYTAAAFANISALPANPTHAGLVAEGWNWTLADAKTYVAIYGKLDIGQMYHTASGKSEYDVEVNEAMGFTVAVYLSGTEKDWGDGTVDTLESHTYTTAGIYTIKIGGPQLPPDIIPSLGLPCFIWQLKAARLSAEVTEIRTGFRGRSRLQTITIPSSVTEIIYEAFYDCELLKAAVIPSNVTGEFAPFQYCYSLQKVSLPKSVTNIAREGFTRCYSLQTITLPSSITSIGYRAFYQCYTLKYAIIPRGSIGDEAFRLCPKLQSATISSNVTSIGESSFSGSLLQSINIGEGVTSIKKLAFSTLPVTSVTIGSNVASIGDQAFWNNIQLRTLTVLAVTPPTLGSNVFTSPGGGSALRTIYIPNGTLTAYQNATNWSEYSSLFVELSA